jgi:hypothetical protein
MQRMKDYVVNGTKEKRWNTVYSLFQLMVLNLLQLNVQQARLAIHHDFLKATK